MRFRCRACGALPLHFEWEDNGGQCPKCGRSHLHQPLVVHQLCDVHLMVMDPAGPIPSAVGGRQRIACQPKREHLCLPYEEFSATGDPRAVTCPSCKGTPAYRDMAKQYAELEAAVRGGIEIKGGGCCG